MTDEKKQEFVNRITNANRTELIVVLYDMFTEYVNEAAAGYEDGAKGSDDSKASLDKANEVLNHLKSDLDFSQDIVLTPRNDDEANGAAAIVPLNADLVEIANPRDGKEDGKFKAGDRVLNTKNLPNLDIWNGTTATVMAARESV